MAANLQYGQFVQAPAHVIYDAENPGSMTFGVYAPENHPNHSVVNPFIYAGNHLFVQPDVGDVQRVVGSRVGDVIYIAVAIPFVSSETTNQYTVYSPKGEDVGITNGYWDVVTVLVTNP
jgi:hypothetical protein